MNKYYLAKRDEYILDKYQMRFGHRPRRLPKINLTLSGGGYRAAICSLALLMAFETHGLLDWIRSVASLSGSSWLIMSWMTHGVRLSELKEILKEKMKFQLFSSNQDIMSAIQLLTLKYKNGQPISLVDIWGAAIGNTFLPKPNMKLSELQVQVEKANYPFPTFAAIRNIGGNYEWLEFTPAELTFLQQGHIVPMNYINSLWAAGTVVQEYPEEPIESLLGIFGSAFCANFEDIRRICGTNPYRLVLFQTLGQLLDRFQLRHYRLARGQLLNPLLKYESHNSPRDDDPIIEIFDAGIDFNYPLISALKQNPDIVIVCDATDDDRRHNLSQMSIHLDKYNLSLPPVSPQQNLAEPFLCHRTHSNQPDLFYIPNNVNFSTFKLKYEPNEFDQLFNSFYEIVSDFIPTIIEHFHQLTYKFL